MIKKELIIEIVEEVIGKKLPDETINLFDFGLDSLGILKVISHLEDRFEIEIDDDELTVDNLSSIEYIFAMVSKYEN
jgi:acyl carrier protein